VAYAIARGTDADHPLEVCDGAAITQAAGERPRGDGAGDGVCLLVRDVDELDAAEQSALMRLLDTRGHGRYRRVIAMSTVSLWDRVEQGRFDAGLFYRLNVIHIVSPPVGEGAEAMMPRSSGDADGGDPPRHESAARDLGARGAGDLPGGTVSSTIAW
jgi:hypothetical protein